MYAVNPGRAVDISAASPHGLQGCLKTLGPEIEISLLGVGREIGDVKVSCTVHDTVRT